MEMVVNFNPQLLLQHRVDTVHLNSVLTFVRSLQSGYVNPYDENMGLPDVPNFEPQEELDKALINFTKIPPIPTFLPKIVRPKNVGDDDDKKGGGRPLLSRLWKILMISMTPSLRAVMGVRERANRMVASIPISIRL